jgi:hypothetical protein
MRIQSTLVILIAVAGCVDRSSDGPARRPPAALALAAVNATELPLADCSSDAGLCASGPLNPAPPAAGASVTLPTAQPSTVMVPLSFPMSAVRQMIDQNIPREWAEWDAWVRPDHACIKYRVRRGDVKFSMSGTHVSASIPGTFDFIGCASINNHMCGPCVSCSNVSVEVPLSADVSIDPGWRLNAPLRNDGVRIGECRLGVVRFNANGKIRAVTNPRVDAAVTRANERIGKLTDFKTKGQAVWSKLFDPIQVSQGWWLMLRPVSAQIAPLSGSGGTITTAVGVTASPILVASAQPPASTAAPLPPLQIVPPTNAFHLSMDVELPYNAARSDLAARIVGKRYPLQNGQLWVKITGVDVYGSGATAVLKLDVGEDIKGTLFLVGTPTYEPATDVLSVANLDYSLETKNALVHAVSLAQHASIAELIAAEARWSTGRQLTQLKVDLQAALNKTYGPVTLSGAVTGLRVAGVASDADKFTARVVADGTVQAAVP